MNQATIKEASLEENNLEIPYDEESVDSNEDWMLFKARALKSKGNGLFLKGPSVLRRNEHKLMTVSGKQKKKAKFRKTTLPVIEKDLLV